MENKKNILYVVPSMDTGGVEIGILEICKKINENKDFNVFILTSGGKFLNKINYYGATPIILDVKSKNIFTIILNIKRIKNIIKKYNIDLVQAESRVPAWSAYFACKKLNIPFVTTLHGIYSFSKFKFSAFFKKKYNSIMLKSNVIIAVSDFVKNFYISNYAKYLKNRSDNDIQTIHRGIDLNLYCKNNLSESRIIMVQKDLNIPEDKFIITLPARFTSIKGHLYLLEALKLIKNKNFICFFVGDDGKNKKYTTEITRAIKRLQLEENIRMHKSITDIQALYYVSSVVVSANNKKPESFGRISIEVQAMEKIFLGTALGGTLETIIDGETGFLAPTDNPQAFADKIEYILQLPEEEKIRIGLNARKNIEEKFDINYFFKNLKNLYNSLLNK